MIEAAGNRVLVKPDPIQKKTKGGLIIEFGSNERLEEGARVTGTVHFVGKICWFDYPGWDETEMINKLPWCRVGDRISWAKYAGVQKVDPETQEKYVVLNDVDVVTVIKDAHSE